MAIVVPIESQGGVRRLRLKSPATGETIGEIRVTPPDEVRAVVARARAAQSAWEKAGVGERARVMRKALALLLERQEKYIDVIVRETGRSRVETIMMEMFPACDSLAYYAKHAKRILADKKVPMHLLRSTA